MKCPKCGGEAVEIIYGMPTHELFEAEQRGEVVIGGCLVSGDDDNWQCKKCGYSWKGEENA